MDNENSRQNICEHFAEMAKAMIKVPLLINAGASVALVGFFSEGKCSLHVAKPIEWATSFFVLGVIFGILTLTFEYASAFLLWRSPFNDPALTNETIKTIKFRIFNGALSILLCFSGIFCVANYLTTQHFFVYLITALLIIYTIGTLVWLNVMLNRESFLR